MNQEDKDFVLSKGAIFIEDEIFYIPDFFPKDLIKAIREEIDSEVDWFYSEHGATFKDIMCIKNEESVKKIKSIYDDFSMWPSLMNGKKVENWDRQDVPWVKRRGAGTIGNGMDPHWDGDPSPKYVGGDAGSMQIPNRVKWGGVVYLNDDFNDGEINYLEIGLKFKPISGAMIFHPGDNAKYRHSVEPADNKRYNLIFNFMYGDVNKPEDGEDIYDFSKNPRLRGSKES